MISHKRLILVFLIGVAYVLVVILTQRAGYDFVVCPSRLVYDLPCAGCGGTRAFLLLLRGHPVDAFFMNPNVYLFLPLFLTCGCLWTYDIIHHTNRLNDWYARFKQWCNRPVVYVPILVVEAVIWGYNIWRYRHGML